MYVYQIFNLFSRRIAIAGNNKRISILDLSTLKEDNVECQSLTSKIQGKVLALAWHPVNENLLSFSTNEGRIGTFNISKTSNAPDLMMNFNGKDLYSLCYSADADSKRCTLYASSGNKLMMFSENSTKSDNHKSIEYPVSISSVSVNAKYIAVGFSNGTLKILMNNEDKTVCTFSCRIVFSFQRNIEISIPIPDKTGRILRCNIEEVFIRNVMVTS